MVNGGVISHNKFRIKLRNLMILIQTDMFFVKSSKKMDIRESIYMFILALLNFTNHRYIYNVYIVKYMLHNVKSPTL